MNIYFIAIGGSVMLNLVLTLYHKGYIVTGSNEQSKDKTRVVIGGSHGKTTITSIILHVMKYHDIEVNYMVGAQHSYI